MDRLVSKPPNKEKHLARVLLYDVFIVFAYLWFMFSFYHASLVFVLVRESDSHRNERVRSKVSLLLDRFIPRRVGTMESIQKSHLAVAFVETENIEIYSAPPWLVIVELSDIPNKLKK